MIRKSVMALALLFNPLLAMAGVHPYPYAGLDVSVAGGGATLYDVTGVRYHYSNTGTAGGAVAGMGLLFCHTWLAVEANGDFSSERTASATIATASGRSDAMIRLRNTWGASLIPGVWISRLLLFGRAGLQQASIVLKQDNPPAGSSSLSNRTAAGGVIYGGGVEWRLSSLWLVRVEYDRTVYRRFTSFANRISFTDSLMRFGLLLDLS